MRILIVLCFLTISHAFLTSVNFKNSMLIKAPVSSNTELLACRRNNKLEKRKRNRAYARKFQSTKGAPSRRKVVIEEKRQVVAASEEKFVAQLFKLTTEEDMPAYSGFDFAR